ncbi:unnamed protein product (macronuclear) [Paramecium tetraurelia]|uniref:Transmembrane protein n=1 Tax=Paramecium tetraurelia TaxID=5888 RepID=A0DDS7_PARTE|nr:uncharacterized protein GSPATT00016035001 [Paramecium tetraurelia]CAK81194.1 unnamed protein product [Paramecium tetraurelia]|eukprot:XP_001448591.1 hypothetical protein (macronuclear) [Paramecium tetraurelia strain d4-2]
MQTFLLFGQIRSMLDDWKQIWNLIFIKIEMINLKQKTIMNKILKYMKSLDIFGQNIQLNFNGQNQYQTATGGFFSLAIIAVIAFFFQQNILNFIHRVDIHLNAQTIFDFNPDRITFNEDNYMFALAVDQTNFNTLPFFNITLKQRTYTRSSDGSLNKQDNFIDLIPCTQDRFQKIFKNQDFSVQFSQLKLEEWLCPQLNYSIQLGGSFTSDIFEFVKITVSECSNNSNSNSILSWKPQCASTQARDRYLQQERSFRIRMYMTNNVINPLQVQNVSQTFLDDETYFSFLLQTGTEADVFYQKYNITTDDNVIPILKKIDEEIINVKRAGDFKTKIVQNNDQQFSAIYLRRSPYTQIVKRELQDISDLLSYLGGFANIVALVFGILIKSYNKSRCIRSITYLVMIDLANYVYDFPTKSISIADSQERKEIKKVIAKARSRTIVKQQGQDQELHSQMQSPKHTQIQLQQNDTKQQELYNISKQDEIYQVKSELQITNRQEEQLLFYQEQEKIILKLGIQDRKSYLTQQIQKILNRSKPILFNCKYILSMVFCSKLFYDRNSILLHKAIKKINQDLDICVVIDTVKEINLIKELLLTKDQLVLFDFAPKQVIDLQEDEKSIMTRSQGSNSLETMRSNSNQKEVQNQNKSIQAYYKLFQAYDHIHKQLQQDNKINEKLIEKLGQEVRDIFDVSHLIQWERKSIKCLKDDMQDDSVNSDPLSINNVEQIKINVKLST